MTHASAQPPDAGDRRARRPAVLVISERRANVDVITDAVGAIGGALLLVADFDRAITAITSGFDPDAILVDLAASTDALYGFLRRLFEDPMTRRIPVLGTSSRKSALFQLAPRGSQREVPFPSNPAAVRAILEAVASG